MPTKTLLRSAEVMHLAARRAAEFGVEIDGVVRFNMRTAVERKDGIVRGITGSIHAALRKRQDSITFIRGAARFAGRHEIAVGQERVTSRHIIIATGARRAVPLIEGLDAVEYLTNRSALELDHVPSSMLVVGGGYVGIEFAQMFARFGSHVTILGRNPQLARGEDAELSALLAGTLRDEGITVHTNVSVTAILRSEAAYVATAISDGGEQRFEADALLVAAGRVGNTDDLDLSVAGVIAEKHGFIPTNDTLQTNQPHIFAIGDVKGGWMFTHVATYDGPIAAQNAVRDAGRTVDYRVVPRVIFSDPTLAAVGLTDVEARAQGYDVAVGSISATGARAMAIGDTRGRLKAVVNKSDGEILGFHVLAPHGDDLLHEAVAAMHGRGGIDRIRTSIHAHPTLSEMVKAAARAATLDPIL